MPAKFRERQKLPSRQPDDLKFKSLPAKEKPGAGAGFRKFTR
jgi:hypothetical protein